MPLTKFVGPLKEKSSHMCVTERSIIKRLHPWNFYLAPRMFCLRYQLLFSFSLLSNKIINFQEEMFSNHVYEIPWYYFNPQQRKTFFILLNESTRRIRFFALKMFPFVPQTCLNVSQLIYSFASFLYGEINKRKIR